MAGVVKEHTEALGRVLSTASSYDQGWDVRAAFQENLENARKNPKHATHGEAVGYAVRLTEGEIKDNWQMQMEREEKMEVRTADSRVGREAQIERLQAERHHLKTHGDTDPGRVEQVSEELKRLRISQSDEHINGVRQRLEAERNAIVATLAHIQEIPVAERPVGIETKYGRVVEIGRELGVTDPYTQGYEAEKRRLNEVLPRTVEQMTAIAEKEERLSGPRAHAEITINRNKSEITDDEFQYLRGEKAAIQQWVFEQRPRLVVAAELDRYAESQGFRTYVNAESAMARNFSAQLAAGKTEIDLTQHYATGDQNKASDRHVKAVENLWPLIEEARNHGYMVNTGHAITQQQKQAEVMAVSEGYRV